MASQLELGTITLQADRARWRAAHRFAREHREQYLGFAAGIGPDLSDRHAVLERVVFSVLSANAGFDSAVAALSYCRVSNWQPDADELARYSMVPAKAEWIREIASRDFRSFLRGSEETWDAYRLRLYQSVPGLGLAKASFAACLLYPLSADLGCVDTWIQKVFLGHSGFKTIGLKKYRAVEKGIRQFGRRHKVPTFVAQWLIWDHVRGTVSDHAIFPGSHKGTEEAIAAASVPF